MENPASSYAALQSGAGLVAMTGRTCLVLRGNDRATLLHNLSTNNIRGLAEGHGCEAFLTNIHGKVLAHLEVEADQDCLRLQTVPGQAEKILAHLDRYIIREDVQLADESAATTVYFVGGPAARSTLALAVTGPLPEELLAFTTATIGGRDVMLTSVDWTGPGGFRLAGRTDEAADVQAALLAAGCVDCDPTAFDVARLAAGTPFYGQDITEQNLAQEVARDTRAISFTKGCYLGQETIARIDALGHVNQTLCRFTLDGTEAPPPGSEIFAADKPVGRVTSSAAMPVLSPIPENSESGRILGLAYIKRGYNAPTTSLQFSDGRVVVLFA